MILGGAARNRMLIKGGSSFNALVRALKQDVVTGVAPTTTASDRLMYEVDKVQTPGAWCACCCAANLSMSAYSMLVQVTDPARRLCWEVTCVC